MIAEILARLRFLLHRKSTDDLDAELRAHVNHAIDMNLALGISPAEARRRALIDFGGMEVAREQPRDLRPHYAKRS